MPFSQNAKEYLDALVEELGQEHHKLNPNLTPDDITKYNNENTRIIIHNYYFKDVMNELIDCVIVHN